MIQYTASDLVKSAKQIADLENSDFISWNENIRLLNESYVGLYQKLINKGDQNFVCSFLTADKEITLPCDFWQLKNVAIWNNGNIIPILRRSASASFNTTYYELRNGVLYLFGNYSGEVLVEYWKTPKTLYYPSEKMEVDFNWTTEKVVACHDKHYVEYDSGNYVLKNLNDSSEFMLNLGGAVNAEQIVLTKNYVLLSGKDADGKCHVCISNYQNNMIVNYSGSIGEIPFLIGHSVFSYEPSSKTMILVYSPDGQEGFDIDLSKEIGTENYDFGWMLPNGSVVFQLGGSNINVSRTVDICGKRFSTVASGIHTFGNQVFLPTYAGIVVYNTDTECSKTIQTTDTPLAFAKNDFNTGYGFYTYDADHNVYINSFLEDTVLDFPNSFYYEILSYILAVAYKSKQGADYSAIMDKLGQMETTFWDTLSNDDYQPMRITNVY